MLANEIQEPDEEIRSGWSLRRSLALTAAILLALVVTVIGVAQDWFRAQPSPGSSLKAEKSSGSHKVSNMATPVKPSASRAVGEESIDERQVRFYRVQMELNEDAENMLHGQRILAVIRSKPAGHVVHLPIPTDWESSGPGRYYGRKDGVGMMVAVDLMPIDPAAVIVGDEAKEESLIESVLQPDVPEATVAMKRILSKAANARRGTMSCDYTCTFKGRQHRVTSHKHAWITDGLLVAVHSTVTADAADEYFAKQGNTICAPLLDTMTFCVQPIVDTGRIVKAKETPPKKPEHEIPQSDVDLDPITGP